MEFVDFFATIFMWVSTIMIIATCIGTMILFVWVANKDVHNIFLHIIVTIIAIILSLIGDYYVFFSHTRLFY
jgi:hypothetical protein